MSTAQITAPAREIAWPERRAGALVAAGLLASAFIYLIFGLPYAAGYGEFRMTLWRWLTLAWADPTWQHGALAAPTVAFLVWRQWGRLTALEAKPTSLGLVLAVLCLMAYWVGYRGNFYYIGYASIHVLVAAVILWIFGWQHMKALGFAWLMLGFAWPYLFLEDTLAFQLRYLMVGFTVKLLNFVGVHTLQEGTALVSAASGARVQGEIFSLHVDGPCSGMRSLFALMAVSAMYGYFRQRTWWRRWLVFFMSIPLAMLSNMARILVLVFGSMVFGQTFAVGKGDHYASNFHLLAGVAVYLVALAGLVGVERGINRLFGREKPLKLVEAKPC
jgi:exosortase